jgi:hypothetical protein
MSDPIFLPAETPLENEWSIAWATDESKAESVQSFNGLLMNSDSRG